MTKILFLLDGTIDVSGGSPIIGTYVHTSLSIFSAILVSARFDDSGKFLFFVNTHDFQ